MSNSEILEKAIQKAVAGGWELPHEAYDFKAMPNDMIRFTSLEDETQSPGFWFMPLEQLIFNHDFAKALWGDNTHWTEHQADPIANVWKPGKGDGTKPTGYANGLPLWQYRLQQMVIADDPIKYLGDKI